MFIMYNVVSVVWQTVIRNNGHIMRGETIIRAIKTSRTERESNENCETNINLAPRVAGSHDNKKSPVLGFLCSLVTTEPPSKT